MIRIAFTLMSMMSVGSFAAVCMATANCKHSTATCTGSGTYFYTHGACGESGNALSCTTIVNPDEAKHTNPQPISATEYVCCNARGFALAIRDKKLLSECVGY